MRTGLAFSGGKDSWACLWLNHARLHEIDVIWINTGKGYPETLALIEQARGMCPNFHEIRTDRDGQNAAEGIPSDVVPVDASSLGMLVTGEKPVKVQSYLNCCWNNIGAHLHETAKSLGLTHLIRGQRADEHHKSTARHGDIHDGITYLQPIENWSSARVLAFLEKHMPIPDHFSIQHSSLDCYDCTGFSGSSRDRIEWTRARHPALARELDERLTQLNRALADPLAALAAVSPAPEMRHADK